MDNEGRYTATKVQYSTVDQNAQIAVMTAILDQYYAQYKNADEDFGSGLTYQILERQALLKSLLGRLQSFKLGAVPTAEMTETLARIDYNILKLKSHLAQSTADSNLKPLVEIFRLSTVPLKYTPGSIMYAQPQTIRGSEYSAIFPLKNVKSDFVTAGSLFTLASDGTGVSTTRSSSVGTRYRLRMFLPFGYRETFFEVRMHCTITNERDVVIAEVPFCEQLNSMVGDVQRILVVDVENYYTVSTRSILTFTPKIYTSLNSTWKFYQSGSEAFFEVERLFVG